MKWIFILGYLIISDEKVGKILIIIYFMNKNIYEMNIALINFIQN
jgi:hypothetical protein